MHLTVYKGNAKAEKSRVKIGAMKLMTGTISKFRSLRIGNSWLIIKPNISAGTMTILVPCQRTIFLRTTRRSIWISSRMMKMTTRIRIAIGVGQPLC